MAVAKDTLYLYGGLMEVGDREVTLDDLYTLDLNKLDEWKCLIEVIHSLIYPSIVCCKSRNCSPIPGLFLGN